MLRRQNVIAVNILAWLGLERPVNPSHGLEEVLGDCHGLLFFPPVIDEFSKRSREDLTISDWPDRRQVYPGYEDPPHG